MADTLDCPKCGKEVESADELEAQHQVSEVEFNDDGTLDLFESRDLYLCKDCRNPLGVGRS